MRNAITAYTAAALIMAGLDMLWLGLTAQSIYHRALSGVMAEKVNTAAAIAFYAVYILGVTIFAIRPAVEKGDWQTALIYGALFGFFAYATYDLTNLATLKVWSLKVSLIDMAWGTFVSGIAAGISAAITLALEK